MVNVRAALSAYVYPPWVTRTLPNPAGFGIYVLEYIARDLGWNLTFVDDDYSGVYSEAFGLTDWVEHQMESGVYDITAIAVTEIETLNADLSVAFYHLPHVALVKKTFKEDSLWQVFQPFAPSLWYGILGFVTCSAAVMLLLRYSFLTDPKAKRKEISFTAMVSAVYHAWAAMLGGEDYEWQSAPEVIALSAPVKTLTFSNNHGAVTRLKYLGL